MRRAGVLVLVAFLLLVGMGAFAWVGVAQTGGVSYSDASVSPTTLPTGSAVDATILVSNAEDSEQTYNVSVSADGTVEQWENGTIAANDDKNIRIRKTLWEAGERTVTIEAGSTTVSETVTVEEGNPTYHGDNRNIGHYPDQVGPTSLPEEIWNSPGTHNAQPSIVNGTLYSSFTSDTYGVSALDPKTGEVVWSSGIGTSTTPTYANGVLYFGNTDISDPKLYAVDAETGSELGNFSTQSRIQSKPVVVDDTVYFGSDDSNMTALSATELAQGGVSEGDQRWNYTVSESENIAVATPPAVVDGVVYFGTNNDNILAVDSETGDKIWEVAVHDSVRGAPTVVNNTVYFGASLESGSQLQDGMVYALNATDGTEQWTYQLSSNPGLGSVYADGTLYVGASNGKLVALDATDGTELWLRSGSDLSRFDSSPIVVNNTVYVSNLGDDTVQAFDGTDGTELFAYESPGENPGSTPLVWDGMLYYGTLPSDGEGALYAIRDPALAISNMTASNPEAADIQVSFETAQQLSTISVSITGPESVTLTEDDFTESESGPYTYTGTYSGSIGGTYTATLDSAVSSKGDGALNEADSTTIPNGISTWSELDDVRTDLDADYVLLNDLNESTEGYDEFASESANADEGWNPIGIDSSSAFTGTFDGEGHTISDLYIDRSAEDRVGLFHEIGGATISNMSLTNATVSGNTRVALVTGSATVGSIDRVHAEGTVDSAGDSGGFVGGIDDDGASLQISNSSADVDVSGGAGSVGGLLGWGNDAEVSETYVTGNVTTEADRVGGIIGESRDGSISKSYATVNITHESNSYDGLGGLVGLLRGDDGEITESYAAGNISDSDGGGLVGITGDSPTITDSYWDTESTGQDSSAGSSDTDGLSTSQMKGSVAEDNLGGFNFTTTWDRVDTDTEVSYPFLRNNQQEPAPGTVSRLYAGGDGTEENPYEISNWEQLDNVRENPGANFIVITNLNQSVDGYNEIASETANAADGFDPIGNQDDRFTGNFDGAGHTISDLSINRSSESDVGLFGYVGSDGTIESVGLENASIDGDRRVGGLVGRSFSGIVKESYASGNVTGDISVGGLIGRTDGTVNQSYATGSVEGFTRNVGGLVGWNDGTVNQSYATGSVDGSNDVGGLVGENNGDVSASYATGNVTGSSNNVGGLVGLNTNTIDSSYSAGSVTGGSFVGGLVGRHDSGDVTRSYWDVDRSGLEDATGEGGESGVDGLTTEQMTGADALDDGNMDSFEASIWETVTESTAGAVSDGYPILSALESDSQILVPISPFAGGSGTADDPYQIVDWEGLAAMGSVADSHFVLNNDLNAETHDYDSFGNESANDGKGWDPIGEGGFGGTRFAGTLDGQSHTIADLQINRPTETDVGLFAALDAATIRNLDIVDSQITGGSSDNAILAANSYGVSTFDNIAITGTITVDGSVRRTGALVGNARSMMAEDISVDAQITTIVTGDPTHSHQVQDVGLLVGYLDNRDTDPTLNNVSVTGGIESNNATSDGQSSSHSVTKVGLGIGRTAASTTIANTSFDGNIAINNASDSVSEVGVGFGRGQSDMTISDTSFDGNISIDGQDRIEQVGLVSGSLLPGTTVTNISAVGNAAIVASENVHSIGLFSGSARDEQNVSASSVAGTIDIEAGTDAEWIGLMSGLGDADNRIQQFSSSGDITIAVNGDVTNVGGLYGRSQVGTELTEVFTVGSIQVDATSAGNVSRIGGLAGSIKEDGIPDSEKPFKTTDSYAITDVSVTNANGVSHAGGLFGVLEGPDAEFYSAVDPIQTNITTSYAAGRLPNGDAIGGLIGEVIEKSEVTITDSYWDRIATGQSNSVGGAIGLGTTDMIGTEALTNMNGFDTETWSTVTKDTESADGDGYPILERLNSELQIVVPTIINADGMAVEVDPESTQTAGETLTGPPTANVTDASGEPVDGISVTASANESDVLSGTTTVETDTDGTAVFDNLRINKSGEYNISMELVDDATVNTTSVGFSVEPAAATTFAIDSSSDTITAGEEFSLTISAVDEFGNPTVNQSLTNFAVDSEFDGRVFDPTTLALDVTGSSQIQIDTDQVKTTNDSHTLTATADGLVSNSTDLAVESAAADSLTIDSQPANTTAGETIGGSPTVSVVDSFDNPVANENVAVLVDGSIALLGTTELETNESGTAEFDSLRIEAAGTHELSFELSNNGAVNTTTETFEITAANATAVAVESQPTESTAGKPIAGPPQATVTDTFGNLVDGVTVTVSETGGYTFDSGTKANVTTDGVATFDDLGITTTGDTYQLNFSINASDAGVDTNADTQTETFSVSSAAANSLQIISAPETVTAGETVSLTINATDEFGSLAANQSLTDVEVSSEFDGTVFGPTNRTLNETGTADLTIPSELVTTANDTHTLTVTADSLTGDSTDITVNPATGDSIGIESQPTDSTAGESITGPPRVTITDAFDNPVDGENVTVSINGSAALAGTTEVKTNSSGVAVFDNLSAEDAGTYMLTFELSTASIYGATTDPFEITSAAADTLGVDSQPVDTTAGEHSIDPPTVSVTDEFDNPVVSETVTATLDGSEDLFGTTAVETNGSGIAVFDDLIIETAGEYTLSFGTTNGVNETTTTFEITPADASSLTVDDVTETAGQTGTLQASLTDEFDNRIADEQLTLTELDGLSVSTPNATTNQTGIAFFEFDEQAAGEYSLQTEMAADTQINDTATVRIEPDIPEAVTIDQNVERLNVSDDFTDDNTLIANVSPVDAFNNPVPDTLVNVTHNGTNIEFQDGTSQLTDVDGTASFAIQSTEPQADVRFTFTEKASGSDHSAQIDGVRFDEITPVAAAAANSYTVSAGTNVTFRATDSTVPQGSNPAYEWTFNWNDGTENRTATGETITESFIADGTVTATLNMTVANRSVTDSTTITVEDRTAPTARLDVPETVHVGESFSFVASNTTDNVVDTAALDYEWVFGNGSTGSGTGLTTPTGNYSTPGVYDVELTVSDSAGNTDTNTTTVIARGSNATIADDDLMFGAVGANSTNTLSVRISNHGTTPLNVTDTDVSGADAGAFTTLGTAEPVIAPGKSQSVRVGFTPTEAGEYAATFGIDTNSTVGETHTQLNLTGTGVESDIVSTTTSRTIGTASVTHTAQANITFENEGTSDAELVDATIHGDDSDRFSVVDGLPEIGAGDTGNVTVAFDPVTDGERTATLRVETADGQTAHTTVEATGTSPALDLDDAVTFETVGINTSNTVTETITVTNDGSQTLDLDENETTISGVDATEFAIEHLPDEIVAGGTDEIVLNFTDPKAVGTYDALLAIRHNDTFLDNESTVDLSAQAEAAIINVGASNINFGNVEIGQPETERLTIENRPESKANLTVLDATISGTNADVFEIDSQPESQIPPGETGEITVNLTTNESNQNAQLRIETDAANEQRTYVYLSSEDTYINVREISNPTVGIEGGNLPAGSSHDVSVSTTSTEASAVTVEKLGMSVNNDSFNTVLQNSESAFTNSLDPGDDDLLQYVELNHTDHDSDATFDDTKITFSVDSESLPANADHEDIVLNRYNETDGEWNRLDVQFLEEANGAFRYYVETPGFSEFAITVTETDDGPTPSRSFGSGLSEPSEPTVTSEPSESGDLSVSISGQQASDRITVDGASADTGSLLSGVETIQVDSLTVGLNTDREIRFDVSTYESDLTPSYGHETASELSNRLSTSSASFEAETRTLSAGYVYIDHDLSDEEVDNVSLGFSIRQSYLDEIGVDPESVTLYREEPNDWNALPTNPIESTDSHVRFESTSPGLSVFATGTGTTPVGVTETTLRDEQIETGENATVDVRIENRGQNSAEHTLELTADGEIVASTNISLDAGETAETTLSFEPAAGEYAMAVGGTEAGTLTVTEPDQPLSWLWLLVGLVILSVVVLWRRSRHTDHEEALQH